MMVLYAFGSNGSGQLGIGHFEDRSCPEPCLGILRGEEPVTLSAGGNHTMVLTSSGNLYTAGSGLAPINYNDDENLSNSGRYSGFSRVKMPTTSVGSVKFCSATWAAAITVNESNEIHTWGHGEKGELGRGQDVSFADLQGEPFKLSKDLGESVSIMSLASGVGHCIAVLSNGDVYGWGDGRKGQLGTPNERYYEPRKVLGIDFKVVRAVCGNEFTYLVGDPQSGCHVLLGSDKWKVRSQMPADCTGWKDVGATWGSIFILREDGAIISWGRDDMGQLAPDTEAEMMAIGSEHSLALNKEGHVFAWGWGEHGNCGPQGIQPATSSSIGYRGSYAIDQSSISGTVAGLGAGCATSFMWIKQ